MSKSIRLSNLTMVPTTFTVDNDRKQSNQELPMYGGTGSIPFNNNITISKLFFYLIINFSNNKFIKNSNFINYLCSKNQF